MTCMLDLRLAPHCSAQFLKYGAKSGAYFKNILDVRLLHPSQRLSMQITHADGTPEVYAPVPHATGTSCHLQYRETLN
jgi:hypothetical protein